MNYANKGYRKFEQTRWLILTIEISPGGNLMFKQAGYRRSLSGPLQDKMVDDMISSCKHIVSLEDHVDFFPSEVV